MAVFSHRLVRERAHRSDSDPLRGIMRAGAAARPSAARTAVRRAPRSAAALTPRGGGEGGAERGRWEGRVVEVTMSAFMASPGRDRRGGGGVRKMKTKLGQPSFEKRANRCNLRQILLAS